MEENAEIDLNMVMDIGNVEKEKTATCKLDESVSAGKQVIQGNFICTVELDPSEGKLKPSTIALSKDNSEISGISDLDEVSLSPKLTDDAIAETNKRKENGEPINDLSLVPDYYNEKISPPPVLILDSIDADSCEDKGILKIKGKIEGADITEEMKIDLPLAYPTSSLKCDIDIPNENGDIEANCAVQTAY